MGRSMSLRKAVIRKEVALRNGGLKWQVNIGFASLSGELVAYLVMEYLDGCTLADVLKEEKRLPLEGSTHGSSVLNTYRRLGEPMCWRDRLLNF